MAPRAIDDAEIARRVEAGLRVPLRDLTPYAKQLENYRLIVSRLDAKGGEVYNKQGFASRIVNPDGSLANSVLSNYLNRLQLGGWITMERRGKRTFRIKLLHILSDEDRVDVGQTEKSAEPPTPEPAPAEKVPRLPEPATATEVDEPPLTDELGMRGGRLAARIEKAVPELVAGAVREALDESMTTMLGALGFYRGANPAEVQAIEDRNHELESTVARLTGQVENMVEDRKRLLVMIDYLNEQEEARLRGTNDGQIASKQSLTARQVPDVFRRTAEFCLALGFTIQKTRGNHLAWKSPPPNSRTLYSASTPGEPTVDRILWRKLRLIGVPDIPRNWHAGDPVPPMREVTGATVSMHGGITEG